MERQEIDKSFRPIFRAVGILIGYNLALAALKFWMGGLTMSEAVRSDGWNNFADSLYSILLWIGLSIAAQPSDESHPHGHRRFESMIGLAVGLIILSTGVYILIECRHRWLQRVSLHPNVWVIAGLSALLLSKIWMARLCRQTGERHRRPVLILVGKDQQMDVFATLSALIGYGGGVWWSPVLDPLFGGIISFWVFKVGGETVYEHVNQLTGKSAPPAILSAISRAVGESPVLSGMNDLRTHSVGPEYQVSLNVYADKLLTLETVHQAEEELKSRILAIPGVSAVFIHIEPYDSLGQEHQTK